MQKYILTHLNREPSISFFFLIFVFAVLLFIRRSANEKKCGEDNEEGKWRKRVRGLPSVLYVVNCIIIIHRSYCWKKDWKKNCCITKARVNISYLLRWTPKRTWKLQIQCSCVKSNSSRITLLQWNRIIINININSSTTTTTSTTL